MQSGTPKPQFAAWLIDQVGSEQYTGLRYVENKSKFRVPWKHNSRKDCSDEDCKIFRAWAVASGKISDYPIDKAKWKTNFRCALNNLTKRFKMVKDNSRDSDDPHKVYQIINTEYNYEGPMIPDIYTSTSHTPTDCLPSAENDERLHHILTTLDINSHHPEEPQWAEHYHQHNHEVPVSYQPTQAIQPTQVSPEDPQSAPRNYTDLGPEQQPYYHVSPGAQLEPFGQPSIFDLEVSIHYRKKEMLKIPVSCPSLQLHYLCESPEPHIHKLCFPHTDSLLDSKQVDFTNQILQSIQRGLLLEVQNTGIYGYRQDNCRVFSSTGDPREVHPDPKTIPQNEVVQLLSFEKYMTDLKAFKENRGGSPDYTIHMCFGEKFPDGKPLEKKLIVVKVVPLICRYFHEMAQAEGASSLHNDTVSLQISHNSLYDLIHATFSLPTMDGPQHAAGPL